MDHVIHGTGTVNPDQQRHEGSAATTSSRWPAGDTAELRLRLSRRRRARGSTWVATMQARQAEADDFYAALTPPAATADEALILRQAFAGLLWSKQFFHYDVEEWLDGDPAGPRAAAEPAERPERRRGATSTTATSSRCPTRGSTRGTRHGTSAFHCVALAHVDPEFAKDQLLLLCREWYMHPNGQLPAYEWSFGDVNPPVHAWAALRVFEIDGSTDCRLPRADACTSCCSTSRGG